MEKELIFIFLFPDGRMDLEPAEDEEGKLNFNGSFVGLRH